ncbi:alpha/beta fold hydrolase [bacterium]|nr:alpha/beta fold hydrolase [bacterium]
MRALALHGFLGDGADWDGFRAALSMPSLTLDAPDLPGHGRAPHPVPPHFAAWVQWICERLHMATEPVHLLGYSMGGRLALAAAMAEARTGRVASLTLLGATAGLVGRQERDARAAADAERAEALVRDGLMPFLDRWYRQPLFGPAAETVGVERLVLRRRFGDPEAMADALRSAGTGAMPNLRPGLGSLRIPVLTVAGNRDEKFAALGAEIAAATPRGEFATLDGVGHALLVEAPEACARLWDRFVHAHATIARSCHE